MELEKYPQKEEECWAAIEALGGFIWSINHDAADGRIEMTEGVKKELADAQRISEKLISEISERFGVIPPKDCPPQRRRWEDARSTSRKNMVLGLVLQNARCVLPRRIRKNHLRGLRIMSGS